MFVRGCGRAQQTLCFMSGTVEQAGAIRHSELVFKKLGMDYALDVISRPQWLCSQLKGQGLHVTVLLIWQEAQSASRALVPAVQEC